MVEEHNFGSLLPKRKEGARRQISSKIENVIKYEGIREGISPSFVIHLRRRQHMEDVRSDDEEDD